MFHPQFQDDTVWMVNERLSSSVALLVTLVATLVRIPGSTTNVEDSVLPKYTFDGVVIFMFTSVPWLL